MKHYSKLISIGALTALAGFIASGPVGFLLVNTVKPQPVWTSARIFVNNYHIVQDIPFYFGFLLTGGMLMLGLGHFLNYTEQNEAKRFRLLLSLGLTIAFFTLISFNYICQTTFIRHLALNYVPEYDALIAGFSMTNPLSFCWANEIWGYGFLGVATWLMAAYYSGNNETIRRLLISNGVVSVATVVFTIVDMHWLMTAPGLIAYFTWNLLMIALVVLIYRYNYRRSH